ncbi:unnamed protein product [Scytosiphon promiscuus]
MGLTLGLGHRWTAALASESPEFCLVPAQKVGPNRTDCQGSVGTTAWVVRAGVRQAASPPTLCSGTADRSSFRVRSRNLFFYG